VRGFTCGRRIFEERATEEYGSRIGEWLDACKVLRADLLARGKAIWMIGKDDEPFVFAGDAASGGGGS